MQKRTLKVALLAIVALILVLGVSGTALAATWPDMPDTVTAPYGVTDNQIASISQGFTDGLWRPYQSVTRAQFVKMAVAASHTPLMDPAVATFTDVPKGSHYYKYVEGAVAAGLVLPGTTFGPNVNISRLDATSIMSRWISMAHGIDLATYYTASEIAGLLSHFGDKASIPAASQALVAFAYDWGITLGDKFGNFNGAGLLTRIQGATFLIRAQAKVPPAMWTADKIEIVSGDGAENLIGKTHTVTFKVTDAAGHPAVGVLVDFDTLYANPLYVGNISPQAAVTDSFGMVSVNLVSHEPGTEKVSATVALADGGLATQVATKYWVAMDEIYILDTVREAENNAGEEHEWCARVVVLGPGPRSTSQFDWYNAIDAAFDPANLNIADGIFADIDSYNDELRLPVGYVPRTMAGIGVDWDIINLVNDNPLTTTVDETVPSVGNIIEVDGAAITPAKSALGMTDAEGVSCITIYSEQTGDTLVQAVATYPENPYPQMLIDRDTVDPEDWEASDDWEQQPKAVASALKTWIPHVIDGDNDAPITPQHAVNNTGEVETFTLTLEDVFGNVIPGYTVEWWIQGVGFFKSDGTTWVGLGEQNKDVDVTDANGQATADVKSLVPGQTILHVKVMDKFGLPYKEWNVTKQWYAVEDVSFGYFDSFGDFWTYDDDDYEDNVVNTGHTFDLAVSGLKYVFSIYDVNVNGLRDDAVLIGDRNDLKAVSGTLVPMNGNLTGAPTKPAGTDLLPGQVLYYQGEYYTRFADIELADNEFWLSTLDSAVDIVAAGLAGKTVYFYNNVGFDFGEPPSSNTPLPTLTADDDGYPEEAGGFPVYVGAITSPTVVTTDEFGMATVDINSTAKGWQMVYAVVDYPANPQTGNPLFPLSWAELNYDSVAKLWLPATDDSVVVFAQGTVAGDTWENPVLDDSEENVETLAVQVFDEFGNALEDYKVTWEIVGQGTIDTTGAVDTYFPYAHFEEPIAHPGQQAGETPGIGDLGEWINSNEVWENATDLADLVFPYDGDDDYAWAWTEDHLIDFELGLVSAANVQLQLDETLGALTAMASNTADPINDFATIVNIQVFNPAGVRIHHQEVTKVWSLDPPTIAAKQLWLGTSATGPWSANLSTNNSPVYFRIQVLDQYGNPWTEADPDLMLAVSGPVAVPAIDVTTAVPDANGFIIDSFIPPAGGAWTLTAFNDTGNATGAGADDGLISPGEITSGPSVLTFTGIGGMTTETSLPE